jgi:cell division septal protein FtsQ
MRFGRKKNSTQAPGSRQVVRGGRAQAFSYSANRNDQDYALGRGVPRDQDIRRREKILRYWRQRLGMFIAGVALVVCVLYTLHLNHQPKVVSLAQSSNSYFLQSTDVYQKAAAQAFASSIFNDNKITVNSVGIQERLQKQFPELSDVSVTIPLMSHRPIVYIAPTSPSLVLANASDSFILDNNGKALLTTSQVAELDKLHLPTVTDQTGLKLKTGDIALAGTAVSFIQTIQAELEAKGVAIESMTLPATGAYELDVKPGGVGYFVKFNLHEDTARQQAGTFLAVRARLATQSITPASYIDVRLDGRAYYK